MWSIISGCLQGLWHPKAQVKKPKQLQTPASLYEKTEVQDSHLPPASKPEPGILASNTVHFQPRQVAYICNLKQYLKHSALDIIKTLSYSVSFIHPLMTTIFFVKGARGEVGKKHRNKNTPEPLLCSQLKQKPALYFPFTSTQRG